MTDFSNHTIISTPSPAHWLLRKQGTGVYHADVTVLPYCIIITGDGPDCIIRGSPSDPRDAVHWLAFSSTDYIADKMALPSGWDWSASAACEHLEDLVEQDPDYDIDPECALDFDNQAAFCEWASEYGVDDVGSIGRVPSPAVYYAQDVARRLMDLLTSTPHLPE